jgi:hypothetical protein
VAPDVHVARGGTAAPGRDPILDAGLAEAARLAAEWTPAAAPAATAPEPAMPADARLPGAAELRERLARAYGTRPPNGMVQKGRMEVPGTPYAGPFTAVYVPDQRFHMAIDIGLMKISEGYDGSSAWVRDPGGERRALDRDLFVAGLFTRALLGELPLDAHVKGLAPDSLERFDGVPCVRAAARDASGKSWRLWFELAGARLRGSRTNVKTQMGAASVTTTYRDYRTFEGFSIPTDVLTDMGFQQQRLRVETVEFAVPPDTDFTGK